MTMNRELVFGKLPRVASRSGPNPYPVILVFDNRLIGRAGSAVVADSEAIEGNMEATKLLTEFSFDRWRSGSLATVSQLPLPEVSVTFTLDGMSTIDWVSYHWSNILVSWRADLYRGDPLAGGILLGTTDWTHPVVKSEDSDFTYDSFPWILGPSDDRLQRMARERQLSSFSHFAKPIYSVDHVKWRFDVRDGVNGVDDFLQCALIIAGCAFQPNINMAFGAKISPVDRSVSRETAAAVNTGIDRPTHSEVSFSLEYLTAYEAQTALFTDWVRGQPKNARIFVYKEPAPEERLRYYDGGAFVGVREAFEGISVEEEPGAMANVWIAKTASGIKIKQTA